MESKKRVVISGYYGFDNTGDEAVLFSIIQALYKECKKGSLEITVLSNQPEKTTRTYDVKAINRWDIKQVYGAIKNCDLLISGGGSLLQDVTGNKTVPYYLLVIKTAQLLRKEIVFYAQGYGPVNKRYSKFLIQKTLNKVEHIFVRDKDSQKGLKEIGITKVPIMVAADPVLGMETKKELPATVTNVLALDAGKIRVGIYLRSWNNDHLLIDKIHQLCSLLVKEKINIYFIPMQQPEDAFFLKGISLEVFGGRSITEPLDVEEVFTLTGEMDLVIGMRLHALIMATAQKVPVVALSYDPKVDAFMKMINNQDCFNVQDFDPQEVAKSVRAQIDNIKSGKENIRYKRQALLEKVYEPAKRVREILTK